MYRYERFNEKVELILENMKETLAGKGHDYTNTDPLENFKLLDSHGVSPVESALVLINIKINRLNNLLLSNKKPKYESVEDTIKDLANYAVLLQCIIDEPSGVETYGNELQELVGSVLS